MLLQFYGGKPLKRVNGMRLYDLGRCIEHIDSISKNNTYREVRGDCLAGIGGVKGFVLDGEFAGMFDRCIKPAQELIAILKRISDISEKNMDNVISPPMYGDLRNKLLAFDLLLDAEIEGGSLFLTMQKGGYDTKKLLNKGEVMFDSRLEQLCPLAILDVREGMKCLLFERYTAAAFHFHRANEAVLKEYAKRNGVSPPKDKRTLGHYAEELRKKGVHKIIWGELKRIAVDLRNPLIHEDVIITDFREMDEIYSILKSIMYKMIADMTDSFNPPS